MATICQDLNGEKLKIAERGAIGVLQTYGEGLRRPQSMCDKPYAVQIRKDQFLI